MFEEADIEILLLENMLREFESSHELRPQVNDLSFSDLEEEMRFLEECIGRDVSKKDSASSERQIELSHSCDKEEDINEECIEEGNETNLSHIEENTIIGLNRAELTTRLSQGDEGQLLKVVKGEEIHVEDDEQHCNGILEKYQVEECELLECLLKEHEYEDVIANNGEEVY